MLKIKNIFSNIIHRTEFEKSLNELYSEDSSDIPKEKIISNITETLTNKSTIMTNKKGFFILMMNFQYFSHWQSVLKLLYIFHSCLYENPEEFCPLFIENKMKCLLEYTPKDVHDIKEYTHAQVIKIYYNYLYETCLHFRNFMLIKDEKSFNKHIKNMDFKAVLLIYESFIDILRYGTNIQFSLEYSLIHCGENQIIKHVTIGVLLDCIRVYSFVKVFIENNIKNIYDIQDKSEIARLYKIYENFMQLTKKIKNFCALQTILQDERVECPELFQINDEENQKIELFNNKIKFENSQLLKKQLSLEINKFRDLNEIILFENETVSGTAVILKYLPKNMNFIEQNSSKNSTSKTKFKAPLRKVDSKEKYEEEKI